MKRNIKAEIDSVLGRFDENFLEILSKIQLPVTDASLIKGQRQERLFPIYENYNPFKSLRDAEEFFESNRFRILSKQPILSKDPSGKNILPVDSAFALLAEKRPIASPCRGVFPQDFYKLASRMKQSAILFIWLARIENSLMTAASPITNKSISSPVSGKKSRGFRPVRGKGEEAIIEDNSLPEFIHFSSPVGDFRSQTSLSAVSCEQSAEYAVSPMRVDVRIVSSSINLKQLLFLLLQSRGEGTAYILSALESAWEVVNLVDINAQTKVLTVGGATYPYCFLERAGSVQVVDINPFQIEHLKRIQDSIRDKSGVELVKNLVASFIQKLNLSFTEAIYIAVVFDQEYQFLVDMARCEALLPKLDNIAFHVGDIVSYSPSLTFDLVYYSTIVLYRALKGQNTAVEVIKNITSYLEKGATVIHTTFKAPEYSNAISFINSRLAVKYSIRKVTSKDNPEVEYHIVSKRCRASSMFKRSPASPIKPTADNEQLTIIEGDGSILSESIIVKSSLPIRIYELPKAMKPPVEAVLGLLLFMLATGRIQITDSKGIPLERFIGKKQDPKKHQYRDNIIDGVIPDVSISDTQEVSRIENELEASSVFGINI